MPEEHHPLEADHSLHPSQRHVVRGAAHDEPRGAREQRGRCSSVGQFDPSPLQLECVRSLSILKIEGLNSCLVAGGQPRLMTHKGSVALVCSVLLCDQFYHYNTELALPCLLLTHFAGLVPLGHCCLQLLPCHQLLLDVWRGLLPAHSHRAHLLHGQAPQMDVHLHWLV